MSTETPENITRIDICPGCDREIQVEVEDVTGKYELINKAAAEDEGFMSVTGGTAEIRYWCRCSGVKVTYGPGSASAWDFPDEWVDFVSEGEQSND